MIHPQAKSFTDKLIRRVFGKSRRSHGGDTLYDHFSHLHITLNVIRQRQGEEAAYKALNEVIAKSQEVLHEVFVKTIKEVGSISNEEYKRAQELHATEPFKI